MAFARRGNTGAELECRPGLARRADVVVLALDTEQRRLGNRRGLNIATSRDEATGRERMLPEYAPHSLQIEVRRQVHHAEVFVVERLGRLRALAVATHEITEKLRVRGDVPIEVHADETDQLQEAGIDASEGAGIARRDRRDHMP